MAWLQNRKLVVSGIVLGIALYFVDAAISVGSLRETQILDTFFRFDAFEYWTRFSFLLLPIAFGAYAHILLKRARGAANRARNAESFLNAVIDNVPYVVIVKDAENMRYVHFNRAGEHLLGYSREQLIGKNNYDFLPRSQADSISQTDYEMIEAATTQMVCEEDIDTRYRGKRRLQTKKAPILDAAGKPAFLLSVAEDVTLRQSGQPSLASAVFESTDQGVIITDRKHRIVTVNPAFRTITGYSLDEVLGKTPVYLKSGRHNEAFFENIWRSLEHKGYWKGEIWNRRKDGETYPSWHTISSVFNNDTGHVTHYVSVFSDITPIKRHQANVDFLAYHDPLTGLPNRLMLSDRLEHALHLRARNRNQVGVLFLDLDGFKDINDTLGHSVGDLLLQETANRLQTMLRGGDTVARLGGDEFVVLAESCDSREGIQRIAEKLLEKVAQPVQLENHNIVVQTSVGIAIGPADGADSQSLLNAADKAMYRAKAHEGSWFCFYTDA